MTANALLKDRAPVHQSVDALEQAILDYIDEEAVVGLDVLIALLPQYSWNQVFHTVDRLSRSGRIALRRHGFDYTLFSSTYAA